MAESGRPVVVCLCGPTRFWEAYQAAALRETLAGRIVLTIGNMTGSDDDTFGDLTPAERDAHVARCNALHFHKINLADEVLVLNVGGYVGEHTRAEVDYARLMHKRVRWLEADQPWHGLPLPPELPVDGEDPF